MAAVASLVPDRPDLVFEHADHSRARWYFAIWAAIITVCFLLLVITVVMAMPRTPWAAAQVALAPTVMLAASAALHQRPDAPELGLAQRLIDA